MADAPGSGNEHKIISYAHALKEHPGFDIAGFVDSDISKTLKATKIYGGWGAESIEFIEYQHINFADVAVVATPDDAHYDILKRLAEYPLRLVICEKPLCTDLQQAREIVGLYKAKKIPLMVDYTRRYLPEYDKLKAYGNPISGFLTFNRGWLHTATHGIDFFEMLGLKHYRISQIQTEDFRVWDLTVYFDSGKHWNEQRIGDMPVWDYYDNAVWHVADNAFEFLEGREPIKCTGDDAVRALEICYELMEGAK